MVNLCGEASDSASDDGSEPDPTRAIQLLLDDASRANAAFSRLSSNASILPQTESFSLRPSSKTQAADCPNLAAQRPNESDTATRFAARDLPGPEQPMLQPRRRLYLGNPFLLKLFNTHGRLLPCSET